MDFTLTDEQRMLHDTVFKFTKNEWEPRTVEIDETDTFPWWLWQRLRESGWCGLLIPEEYGGSGLSVTDACIMFEAAGHAGVLIPWANLAWGVHCSIGGGTNNTFGNQKQKEKYLPRIASGEWITCFSHRTQCRI